MIFLHRGRRFITMVVIFALLFSSLSQPLTGLALTGAEDESQTDLFFQIINDTPVYMEKDNEISQLGTLLEGIQFQVHREDENKIYFILYEDIEVFTSRDAVLWLEDLEVDGEVLVSDQTFIGEATIKEDVVIHTLHDDPILTLEQEVSFPVLYETDEYIALPIGPYIGKVATVDLIIEAVLENQTEEIVEGEITDPLANEKIEEEISETQAKEPQEETATDSQTEQQPTEVTVPNEGTVQTEQVDKTQVASQQFTSSTKYYEVITNNTPVYDNSAGSLVEVGWLKKGQVYPRVRDYGPNWHEIRFGNEKAYVRKADTAPANGTSVKNENVNYHNTNQSFVPKVSIEVYDNSSGQLVSYATLKEGRAYPLVGEYGANWYRVLVSDRVGYVRASEIDLQSQQTKPQPFTNSTKYFEVINDNIPVYDNSTGSLVEVGWLKKGQVYPRVRDYGANWHEIRYGNGFAYVRKVDTRPANGSVVRNENKNFENTARSFIPQADIEVYDNTSGQLVPFGVIKEGRSYPIVGNFGANWYRVLLSDRIGFVRTSEVSLGFSTTDEYFRVTEENVEVYDNSTGRLVKVGELVNGQVYPRVRDYGNWHEIEFGNRKAYVRKASTQPATRSGLRNENRSFENGRFHLIANQNVEVYDNSTGQLVPFARIEKGQKYPVVGAFGANWFRVLVADRVGFVRSSEVKLGATFTSTDEYFQVVSNTAIIYDNSRGSLVPVGELKQGQVYPRIRDYGSNWHQIEFGNSVGYVRKSDTIPATKSGLRNENTTFTNSGERINIPQNIEVYDNSTGNLIPFATIYAGKNYPVVGEFGSNWYRVLVSGRVGFVRVNDLTQTKEEQITWFRADQDVIIYTNETGRLFPVGRLSKGQIYPQSRPYGNWHEIEFGDGVAYVRKSETTKVTNVQVSNLNERYNNKNEYFIALETIEVYDNSSGSLVPFGTIIQGEKYPIVSNYGENWYRVLFAGRVGFVRKKDVRKAPKEVTITNTDIRYYKNRTNSALSNRVSSFFLNPMNGGNFKNAADQMVNGIFILSPYGTFDYSKGIDWATNPSYTRSFMRPFHGHFYLYDLMAAYNQTKDPKYIHTGYKIIEDWVKKNPYLKPQHEMAWHDETTARRLIAWIGFFDLAKDILNEDQLKLMLDSMIIQADLLTKEHYYTRNTNHGMFQDEALLVFSDYFDRLEKAPIYGQLARTRLTDYFEYIMSEEGVHLEHSPGYHQQIANSIFKYKNFFAAKNEPAYARYYSQLYDKMSIFASYILKPDGKFPLIGDTFTRDVPYSFLWTDNPYYQYARTAGATGTAPTATDIVFPEAGYAIFRDSWERKQEGTYVLFYAAYHTGYHKHSDDLGLWIYSDGDIVIEAGPNGYDYDDPFTAYAYSSFAHNTLIVDNESLIRVDHKFDSTYLKDYSIGNQTSSVSGVNKRFEGVGHERKVDYHKDGNIVVVNDFIQSKDQHNYKLLWHLAPDITPIQGENNEIHLYRGEKYVTTISIEGQQKIDISIVKGQTKPNILGWYFRGVRDPIPTHTIVLNFHGRNGHVKTTFDIHN
ncbi:alginate lyase family protein [Alkalihalobacterium sp. APHAB7]|uniref:alginate lyase family protein n=1 Tax=Alkalihalobacterium sp. APHAB7 TaxID=3402081 RepID=UPI003AAA4B08